MLPSPRGSKPIKNDHGTSAAKEMQKIIDKNGQERQKMRKIYTAAHVPTERTITVQYTVDRNRTVHRTRNSHQRRERERRRE